MDHGGSGAADGLLLLPVKRSPLLVDAALDFTSADGKDELKVGIDNSISLKERLDLQNL